MICKLITWTFFFAGIAWMITLVGALVAGACGCL